MALPTRHLSRSARIGLDKLGDALLPGDEDLPAFSELGCGDHIDTVLDEMPASDRDSLKVLLTVCRYLPNFALVGLLAGIERGTNLPGPLGTGVRFLRMGIKGLLLTLYYSGNKGASYTGRNPLDVIGYHVSVYTADIDGAETAVRQTEPIRETAAN